MTVRWESTGSAGSAHSFGVITERQADIEVLAVNDLTSPCNPGPPACATTACWAGSGLR